MKSTRRQLTALLLCLGLGALGASVSAQQKKRDAQSAQSEAIVTAEEAAQLEAVITTVIHPDDAAQVRDALKRSLATGERFSMRYRLRRADGA